MPVVRDNSIGEGLAVLGKGLVNAWDPKREWEARYLKQSIDNAALTGTKTQQEIDEKNRQAAAQEGVISQFDKMLTPEALGIQATLPGGEGARPDPEFQGPMPATIPNPAATNVQGKLDFARAAAKNAILRGGGPGDALNAAYRAVALGQVMGQGAPTDEQAARTTQTFLTGQIPDAKTPLTEQARVRQREEAEQAKLKEAVPAGQYGTILSKPQGVSLGITPNDQGQYWVMPRDTQGGGPFQGTGTDQQAMNFVLAYEKAKAAGLELTPEQERTYRIAKFHLTQPRTTVDSEGRVTTIVPKLPEFTDPAQNPPVPVPGATVPPAVPPVATASPGSTAPPPPPPATVAPTITQAPTATITESPSTTVSQTVPTHGSVKAEDQKTAAYLGRMQAGNAVLARMEQDGKLPSPLGQAVSNPRLDLPGMGEFGSAVVRPYIASNEAQDHRQATEQFATGILRRESGAAISPSEYQSVEQMFIPNASDSKERLHQKTVARQVAMDMMQQGLVANTPQELFATIDARVRELTGGGPAPVPGSTSAPPPAPGGNPAPTPPKRRLKFNPATGSFEEVR